MLWSSILELCFAKVYHCHGNHYDSIIAKHQRYVHCTEKYDIYDMVRIRNVCTLYQNLSAFQNTATMKYPEFQPLNTH